MQLSHQTLCCPTFISKFQVFGFSDTKLKKCIVDFSTCSQVDRKIEEFSPSHVNC